MPKKGDASVNKELNIDIHYRTLNEKTVGDQYPLPNIDDVLDKLRCCSYFTTFDKVNAFHQIDINSKEIPKTVFNVDNRDYEFVTMPFILKNAPAIFQRAMENI